MGRWEPDAEGRFRDAAIALFAERGYEQTTVADIAARAGLTARTFFRHFADKREVLFKGSERLQQLMVDALDKMPPQASAIAAVAEALQASAVFFRDSRGFARRRNAVILANAELRERELIKLAALSAALAEALRRRGVPEPDASLAAEAGIAVFRVAFRQWVEQPEDPTADGAPELRFDSLLRATLTRLRAITGVE